MGSIFVGGGSDGKQSSSRSNPNSFQHPSDGNSLDEPFFERLAGNPFVGAGAVAAFVATLAVGISQIAKETKRTFDEDRAAVINSLREHGGSIAIGVGVQIHILKVEDIVRAEQEPSRLRFQVGTAPRHMLWLDDQHILYARSHDESCTATVKGKEKSYEGNVVSDRIEILDISSGKISTLLNPYLPSESIAAVIGDCKAIDQKNAQKDAENDRDFFDEGRGIKIKIGGDSSGALTVEDLAKDSHSGDIFVKLNSLWYLVERGDVWPLMNDVTEGGALEKTVRVPDITAQEVSPDGVVRLAASTVPVVFKGFGFSSRTESPSLVVDEDAQHGAWLIEKKD